MKGGEKAEYNSSGTAEPRVMLILVSSQALYVGIRRACASPLSLDRWRATPLSRECHSGLAVSPHTHVDRKTDSSRDLVRSAGRVPEYVQAGSLTNRCSGGD